MPPPGRSREEALISRYNFPPPLWRSMAAACMGGDKRIMAGVRIRSRLEANRLWIRTRGSEEESEEEKMSLWHQEEEEED